VQTAGVLNLNWEIWGVAALLLLGGELWTQSFVLLWPSIGAAGAAAGAALGLSTSGQLLIFSISSIALMALSRTVFKKYLGGHRTLDTNVAAMTGRPVEILERAGGIHAPGSVRLGGELWSAFTDDGSLLSPGDPAVVVRVDGLKLCIKRAEPNAPARP
jgi:membrane protein implicated in regulation of membrane protease activity